MNQLGRGVLPPADQPMSVEEIQEVARRLGRANETNPDPNSSMVISTGVLLGLYARERFGGSHYILSTMIGANAYANADDFFSYEGKPDRLAPDADGHGLHALHRLYEAQRGHVFISCPFEEEWQIPVQRPGPRRPAGGRQVQDTRRPHGERRLPGGRACRKPS